VLNLFVSQKYDTAWEIVLTFTELTVDLTAQNVEQVGRRSHADDLHVAVLVLTIKLVWGREDTRLFIRQLQPTLHTTGRVLGTLAVVAVRQRDNQAGTLQPLDFTGSNELVDDALSVVGKVTKLGFPHDEGVGGGQRVAVFKTEATADISTKTEGKKK
jgi:hypothetical protein